MGYIVRSKGKSPEAYPPDQGGQPVIATDSLLTLPVNVFSSLSPPDSVSIIPTTIPAGSDGERIIVMYSGQLQWPYALVDDAPVPSAETITVGIYLGPDTTPAYSITVFVPASNISPVTPPQPVPFSMYWETPSDGEHVIDIRATAPTDNGVWSVSGSLIIISTPV